MRTSPTFLLAAIVLALAPALARAATPASGTLTEAGEPLSYTAGPFFAANPTPVPLSGQPATCGTDGQTCDRYTLDIVLPDNYDITNPEDQVEVRIAWPEPTADFDLYITNEANVVVASAASSSDPEVARFIAGKGTRKLTVRVIPYTPLGQSFTGTVSLLKAGGGGGGEGPAPLPPAASGLPPRFLNYTSPPGLADGAGEPTMGWNRNTQRAMFIAGTETDRVTFPDFMTPALPQACEALWEDITDLASSATTVDPILETEQISGRTFVSNQFVGPNALFAYTDDDGDNWVSASASPPNGGADHQTIGVGPYPAGSPFGNLFDYAVYFCSQSLSAGAFCSRSDTGGASFGAGTPIRTPQECGTAGGIHGHLQVAPDGTAYVPLRTCTKPDGSSTQAISVSEDAGVTWEVRYIPNTEAAQKDPAVGIASDGTLYACYEAPDNSAHAVVSTDKGVTWSKDYNISARVGSKTTRFVTVSAGDPDRAACAFIATGTPGNSEALDFPGFFYGYVATTYDAGETWHTVNVTPDDPVQGAGGVCVSGSNCVGNNRNLLDFNDIIHDEKGLLMFAYADGCVGDCILNPSANSFSDNGVIARQSGGRGLLAEFDGAELQAPKNACLAGTRTELSSKLNWRVPDNGGAEITNYKVFRSTDAATPGDFIGDAGPRATFEDTTADSAVETYYYTVTAENGVGSSVDSNQIELVVVPAPPEQSLCLVPGITVLTDKANDIFDGIGPSQGNSPFYDARALSVSQPYFDNGDYKLVFTLKMQGLPQTPAGATWPVRFCSPGVPDCSDPNAAFGVGNRYFTVQMTTMNSPVPAFQILQPNNADATRRTITADPASNFNADGTITIVVNATDIGLTAEGAGSEQLSKFLTRIVAGAVTPDNMPDSLAGSGQIATVPLTQCAPNTPPLALLTATPTTGTAPLTVRFTVGGSDVDGDALARFTLEFGNGEKLADESFEGSATREYTRTFTQAGVYGAKLTVTDARGLVSSNVDMKMIEVTAAPGGGTPTTPPPVITTPPPAATGTAPGRFGGSLGWAALLPLLISARRRRRQ